MPVRLEPVHSIDHALQSVGESQIQARRQINYCESCWTRCQPLACNAKRALHDSKAQRRPRSLSRSRADEMDCSPAIVQRSYAQPLVPAAPAPSAPSCISSSPHSADCFPEVRSPCSS